MSIFDTPFSFSDPNQMALLGAIAGLGQAAAPSRLPVTGGMVMGDAASGLMGGAQQAYKNQAAQQQLLGQGIQNYQNLYMAQTLAKALGMPTPTANQLRAGKYDDLMKSMPNPGGADTSAQPAAASPDSSQAPVTAAPLPAPDQTNSSAAAPASAGASPLAALQKSIWQIESGGKLQNVPDSSKGAVGPMQVMPDTAKMYGVASDALRDPATNIAVGNKYIADLFAKYNGDPQATAVAYNAGPGVADRWLASNRDPRALPDETQNYLGKLGQLMPNESRGAALIAPLTAASPPSDNGGAAAAGAAAPAAPSAAASGPSSFTPQNFGQMYQQMMLRRFMGLPLTPVEQALYAAKMAPPGSPMQRLDQTAAIKAAGISPFIGGERRGSPIFAYNPATGRYNLEVQNPQLPEGAIEGPNGQISMAPGATGAIAQQAGAEAGGKKGGELPYVGPAAFAGEAGRLQGELTAAQQVELAKERGEQQAKSEYAGPIESAEQHARYGAEYGSLIPGGALAAPSASTGTSVPAAPTRVAPQAGSTLATPPGESAFKSVIPPANSQVMPQSPAEAAAMQKPWQDRKDEFADAVDPAQQAEERLLDQASIYKMIETGAWQEQKGELTSKLKALGVNLSPGLMNDPAAIEAALHENYQGTLNYLKTVNNRFTQREFATLSEYNPNPNLQPAANLQLLAENVAILRRDQAMAKDWEVAQKQGWRNPVSFEAQYMAANPISPIVNAVAKEIGPLKGMTPNATAAGAPYNPTGTGPANAPAITATGPGGHKIKLQNGQWVDFQTGQPLTASPAPPIAR